MSLNIFSYGHTQNKVLFYVGTFTNTDSEGLYLCSFDTITGDMALVNTFRDLDNPNYLVKSDDGEFLYVCQRPKEKTGSGYGSIASFKIDPKTGNISFLNSQSSEGVDPCYVDITPDGKFVALSNYGSGTIAVYKTGKDGRLNNPIQVIQDEGSGPVPDRQKGPHAHSIQFSPFNNLVFTADLGTDKLMIYNFHQSIGNLVEGEIPFAQIKPGSGPRHFDFSPDGKFIYVVNELNSTVSVVNCEKNYEVVQVVKTLPENFVGVNYCADLHISRNGKFLYCSNRGDNSITTFKVKDNGLVEWIDVTPSEGEWPRNFTFSPNGKFMLVANQNSNNITVYKIDQESGLPVFIHKEIKIPSPVCLIF